MIHRDYKLLSIIVPMYDEAQIVETFFDAVIPVLLRLKKPFEVICINDGSRDTTLQVLLKCQQHYPQIKVVDFYKNFGKEAALTAGFEYAKGDIIIPIDVDLQDPPQLIPKLITKWCEGYNEVIAVRSSRKTDGMLKRTTARLFYRFFNRISESPIQHDAGDFRLLDRSVVDVILMLPEKNRFMKGIYGWVNSGREALVYFDREARVGGETKWNYWKLWNFAVDGIIAFSSMPLRIWSYVGLFFASLSLVYMIFLFVKTIFFGADVAGYPSIMCAVLFFGGIQLLSLGILGEYIARLYSESKNRPLYIVRKFYQQKESQHYVEQQFDSVK